MPYIKKELRIILEPSLKDLISRLRTLTNSGDGRNGIVTYVIYKIIKEVYDREKYETYSNAIKVLETAKLEFYNQVLFPYEEMKKKENGEV